MRVRFRTVVVLLAALAVPAGASAGATLFKGKVCTLVSSKTITAINDVSSACSEQPRLQSPGGYDYVGTWKGFTPTTSLEVTIEVFTDTGMLSLATHNLKQGLVGTPKSVSGIGNGAFESKNASAVDLKLVTGKYIAIITLSSVRKPPKSPTELEPLGKAIVTALEVAAAAGPRGVSSRADQRRPTVFPAASMSIRSAAASAGRPGIVCMSPHIATIQPAPV